VDLAGDRDRRAGGDLVHGDRLVSAPGSPAAGAPGGGDDVVVRVRGLENRFGAQVVHDGLDLDVRRGEILGVVGGSGTGKSVLMRSILGLRRPDAGRIEVFGIDALEAEGADRAYIDRRTGVL